LQLHSLCRVLLFRVMTLELLLSLIGFAFVTCITPGPNNIMAMASGANFGVWRTAPHIAGIAIGFALMLVVLGLGLISLFEAVPQSYIVIKAVAVIYFVWLAWKFANAAPPGEGAAGGTPMTFLQASAFQWVNPKAWAMAVGAITNFAPDRNLLSVVAVALTFLIVATPATTMWTILGQEFRRLLNKQHLLKAFNWGMAALLLASLVPVLLH
jgi:threonine/homoserine/homoserine lactone efflux protein